MDKKNMSFSADQVRKTAHTVSELTFEQKINISAFSSLFYIAYIVPRSLL